MYLEDVLRGSKDYEVYKVYKGEYRNYI